MKNQPSSGTTATGPGAAIAWEPEEPPESEQEIPEDGNVLSLPNRPSPEQLKPLYDHFGKERAEEIIEIRWPSTPFPESKYSMSAYQPSSEELLAQRLPGYWRLRELIELSEAGALNGRKRDEMKALAAEFNFHWRMANGTDGGFFSTLNMWAGLTVSGQNPTMNQLMSSVSSMAAVRPTLVRPNLRLEIRSRITQQPVTSAPKTFTTKPTTESPSPKFKIQPVAPPAPLDKVQTVAPNKTVVQKIRYIGGRDVPDATELSGVSTTSGKLHRHGRPLSGEFDFVVGQDGILRIGKGHEFLANAAGNKDFVQAAGRIYVKDGKITLVTNESGHYKPSMQQAENFPRVFKETLEIDLSVAHLKIVEEVFLPFGGMLEPNYIKEHLREIR